MKLTIEEYCRLQNLADSVTKLTVKLPVTRDSLSKIKELCIYYELNKFMYEILIHEPERFWKGRDNNWHWKMKFFDRDTEIKSNYVSYLR